MTIKKDLIKKNRLKRLPENFIETYIEILNDGSILKNTWSNITSISFTQRPFIGYVQKDGNLYFESQYQFHLKSTGMFYFILKNNESHIELTSNIKKKTFLINLIFSISAMVSLVAFNIFFIKMNNINIIIGLMLILFFSIIRPLFTWLSDRSHICQRLVKT